MSFAPLASVHKYRIGVPFMFFNNLGHVPLKAEDIIVSPSRNQGYRKYFETNQKYGLAIQKSGH